MGFAWMPLCASILLLGLSLAPARAQEIAAELLTGRVIVTGREDLAERERGFREGLAEALVKLSGDARLVDHGSFPGLQARAADLVAGFAYEDRHGRKINHEQGTRDRSYWLTIRFEAEAMRRALAELGLRPWTGPRPRLLVLLRVDYGQRSYLVREEGALGRGQREALQSVAERRALAAILPASRETLDLELLARAARGPDPAGDLASGELARKLEAGALLIGFMRLGAEGYWDTAWRARMREGHRARGWNLARATFDRAIAEGLAGAARVMAGLD